MNGTRVDPLHSAKAFEDNNFWDESEDDGFDDDPELTLNDIERSKTINFAIRANYTAWQPREAFRELVQNWRDGIIRSFGVAESDFCVVRREKSAGRNTEIVYLVQRFGDDDKKECLGYIRFKGRDGEGTIEITNRAATLQPRHMDLGGTTKAHDEQQAGVHGEGLKIALLVLMRGRQNHSVRCRTGGFNWRFNFTTSGRLVVRLRRMHVKAISQAEDQARRLSTRTLLPFAARPNGDVQFVIGEPHQGRDERGRSVRRSPVPRESFDAWTSAALFLHDAEAEDGSGSTVLSTAHGDLLTHPQQRGRVYLKGLLLQESTATRSASITNLPLQFGYNFASGRTNRERQSVAGAAEEAVAMLAIWDSILADRPDMVRQLSEMLNSKEPLYADVAGAKHYITRDTATRLREYLVGEQFAGKWYYCEEDKSRNPRFDYIVQGLECEGVELTNTYWSILRKRGLLRTAEEEERRRFSSALPMVAPETPFATSAVRLLRACLRACPQTDGLAVEFVQAGRLHLQLFYSEPEHRFRIHERWLTVSGAADELGLPAELATADILFHTVKRLFSDALEQLPRSAFAQDKDQDQDQDGGRGGGGARTADWWKKLEVSRAEQRLLTHLRMGSIDVEVDTHVRPYSETDGATGCYRPAMFVKWAFDSRWDLRSGSDGEDENDSEIQCHRASCCSHLRDSVLIANEARSDSMACMAPVGEQELGQPSLGTTAGSAAGFLRHPTCQSYQCSRWQGELSVCCPEENEDYFFLLVAKADPSSIVGLSAVVRAPARIRPPSPLPQTALPRLVNNHSLTAPQTATKSISPQPEPQHSPCLVLDAPSIPDDDRDENGALGSCIFSSPEPAVYSRPPRSVSPAHNSGARREAAAQARAAAQPDTFTLVRQLQSLNILDIDKNQWFEAKSSANVRAVVGILSGEKSSLGKSRKRQRLDDVM